MNRTIWNYLRSRPDLYQFVRENPIWYRYFMRDPDMVYHLEQAANRYYGKTFSQKLDQIHEKIQMTAMLIQFAELMKD